ncbi:hypothetical protein Tco_0059709 [Tanacetum coccineum]
MRVQRALKSFCCINKGGKPANHFCLLKNPSQEKPKRKNLGEGKKSTAHGEHSTSKAISNSQTKNATLNLQAIKPLLKEMEDEHNALQRRANPHFGVVHCIESCGQSSFAHYLIEIKADKVLKDSITMGIPLPEGIRFTKETIHVEYKWKPPCCEQCKIFSYMNDQCPKNAMTIPTVINDGFQTMVNKKKSGKTGSTVKTTWKPINQNEKPSKSANVPSSSYSRGSAKNGGLQYHSSMSNIHTSNPYDDLDDMESDEEVEVVYDETTNLLGNNIMRATYTAQDAS